MTGRIISEVYRPALATADSVAYNERLYNPHHAAINAALAGANVLVAGAPLRVIIVLEYVVVCAAQVAVTFESSGGTILGGPMSFAQNGGAAPPFNPVGHFQTLPGEDLVLFLGGAFQVGGHLTYIVV